MLGAASLASCAGHDILSDEDIRGERTDRPMTFGVLTGNLSRATAMEAAGHKDFGVFATKSDLYYPERGVTDDLVMYNYQVQYEDTKKYGSYWQYDHIPGQILKFWDYSKPSHYFAAYTPYGPDNTFTIMTLNLGTPKTTISIMLKEVSSFYLESERDEKEAMCAATKVDKVDYGKEVPLTFYHLNAKIQLAFRSNIPGYTVEILDIVPVDVTVKTGEGEGQSTASARGVQLTPATATEAAKPINWSVSGTNAAQPSLSQSYPIKEQMTITTILGSSTTVAASNYSDENSTNANIVFPLNDSDAGVVAFPISSGSEYTTLKSQYFALPLDDYHDPYLPGFTVHVTYRLKPNDGSAPVTVYDARVFIPEENCKWIFGKQYLYRFTITTNSTGVTNPNTPIYDNGSTPTPYVDPRDPRVPNTKALTPIVFDGVTVNDYSSETIYYDNIN